MNREVEVSIICTVFNHEKYLRSCLDGLVSQKTTFPFEIIVHDDASTDGSADIIREYEKKYPEIMRPIYQTENQYKIYHKIIKPLCLPVARGRFLAFCEGDDYWTDPLKLQKQYDFMNAHPDYALCACSTKWQDQITGETRAQGSVSTDMDVPLEDIILEPNGRIFVFVSYFVKREVYDTLPEWDFPIGDYPVAVYSALLGKVHMLADSMCVYRWHAAGSWTERMNGDEQRRKVSERMIEGLKNIDAFTEGKYSEVIGKRIRKHQYTKALMSHDFRSIREDAELYKMYKARGLTHRAADRLHCACPKLFHWLYRLAGKSVN